MVFHTEGGRIEKHKRPLGCRRNNEWWEPRRLTLGFPSVLLGFSTFFFSGRIGVPFSFFAGCGTDVILVLLDRKYTPARLLRDVHVCCVEEKQDTWVESREAA